MKAKFFPGWWQVVVSMVVQAVSSASVFLCYSIIAAQLQTAYQPSTLVLMLGVTVTVITGGFLGPFIGTAIDRYSIRWLMCLGSICLAGGFFLLSVTTSMLQVLAVYFLLIAVGNLLLGQIPTTALLARWFERRRGLAIGIATSGVALGGVLLPPFLQYLMDSYHWREALQIFSACILLVTAPLILFLVVDRPADRNLAADGDSEAVISTPEAPQIPTKKIVGSFTFWLLVATIGATFAGPFALVSNMIPFVTSNGIDASMGAILLSIYSVVSLFGKLLCAGIADRVDHRMSFVAILLLIAIAMAIYVAADSYVMLLCATALTALAAGAALPLRSIALADIYGANQLGRVMGLFNLCMLPFSLLAPPLFGWSYDLTGSYNLVLSGYLVMVVAVALVLSRARLVIVKPQEDPAVA